LGQRQEVDDRIDLAEWWARLGKAVHRWQEEPADRLIREIEKSRKELGDVTRQLSRLVTLVNRWLEGQTGEENR
jgi:hypothetical protein